MFNRLDTDGSGGIDMDEMTELFKENGLDMNKEDIAEMFSIVSKINKRSKNSMLKSKDVDDSE